MKRATLKERTLCKWEVTSSADESYRAINMEQLESRILRTRDTFISRQTANAKDWLTRVGQLEFALSPLKPMAVWCDATRVIDHDFAANLSNLSTCCVETRQRFSLSSCELVGIAKVDWHSESARLWGAPTWGSKRNQVDLNDIQQVVGENIACSYFFWDQSSALTMTLEWYGAEQHEANTHSARISPLGWQINTGGAEFTLICLATIN